ncbi:hypothetical protein [Novosphingobium album (ex Liu et al. 2023)]|uniref:Serine protease n=1 Tax=Novosphingobium album (ex Liu et al. 2023) TaxID=3031130 RepID=A0ABT5WRZ1_9SPHN|nr:hypothetical protein [Novosphingobium album (ex Liu et al. 2023)]MDE8652511.1 hypothetical protein [Novosphingobium album (ex Liu et al. 2023)]
MANRIQEQLRMLAVRERMREGGAERIGEASANLPADAVPERPAEALDNVADNLRQLRQRDAQWLEGTDATAWEQARDIFLAHAGPMLGRAVGRQAPHPHDGVVAEAVIIADGTRPSFLLCDGKVDPADPFLGTWGGEVATARTAGIDRLAGAVGRIQPQSGHARNFIGTGTLVSADAGDGTGLILTNMHVIEEARSTFGIAMTPVGDALRIDGHMEIDFVGEACSLGRNRFRIVEARYPAGAGRIFTGIDAAVATIVPIDETSRFPVPTPALSTLPAYATGGLTSLATIGFPAAPGFHDDPEVDWNFVIGTLFGNKFGLKRLAPGLFTQPLGSHPEDIGHRAIGHDATTFGGASGSLVVAWLDADTPGFALHFGGQTSASNYAVAFAVERTALEAIGVPFDGAALPPVPTP